VRLVLLASPLLGPAVWTPVAALLRDSGRDVTVAPSPGPVGTPQDVLDAWLPELPVDEDLVLVPHSNAGLYVAALAAVRRVTGVVFVDAGLPGDGGQTSTAPPVFRTMLAGLAGTDGLLPPWTQWWPGEDLDGLFPDPTTRAAVEAEQVRLPLGYFGQRVPSPPGWDEHVAYLGFGDTYAEEQAEPGDGAGRSRCSRGDTCTSWSTRQGSRRRCSGSRPPSERALEREATPEITTKRADSGPTARRRGARSAAIRGPGRHWLDLILGPTWV
jgi:hypothetical protein